MKKRSRAALSYRVWAYFCDGASTWSDRPVPGEDREYWRKQHEEYEREQKRLVEERAKRLARLKDPRRGGLSVQSEGGELSVNETGHLSEAPESSAVVESAAPRRSIAKRILVALGRRS